jgi:hypothetical protein
MPSTRTLVAAVLVGLLLAYGFAFTFFGEVGEVLAVAALIALIYRGLTGAGRRVRHHPH